MKIKILLATVLSFFILHSAFAQGSLTPPGAPAPTMKTLAQIEPRIAITNTTSAVTITNPGSYYLTGNLTVNSVNAITIATNDVTLDLGGFTISSTSAGGAGTGILFSAFNPRDITILNGHIVGGITNNGSGVYAGSGFYDGINYLFYPPVNVLVSKVSVSGCLHYGIYLNPSDSTTVEACTARTIGSYGIVASTIKGCAAADCGYAAIYGDQVSDSRGAQVGNGFGILAISAQNCVGYNSGSGFGLNTYTAQNCYGYNNGTGSALNATTAQNCYGYCNGSGYGIYTTTALNCVGYSNSGTGLYGFIANSCHGSSTTGTALSYSHNINSF